MTKQFSNYSDLITFTRASKGHALRPVSYGDEIINNGDFELGDNGDWGVSTNWTISGGVATLVGGDGVYGNSGLYQVIDLDVGKIYKVSLDVSGLTGTFRVYHASYSTGTNIDSTGTLVFNIVGESGGTRLNILGNNGSAVTLDNISVKEVTFDQPDGTLTLFEHPNNVPRVEYDADGNRLGLLVEEARTNQFIESEDFVGSAWYSQLVTATQDAVGPDKKANSAATITDDNSGGTGEAYVLESVSSLTTGNDYTASVFAKAGSNSWIALKVNALGISGNLAYFDLSNGVLGSVGAGVTATMEDYGNGWYRCSTTFEAGSDTSGSIRIQIAKNDNNKTLNLDGTNSILIFGAQLEAGSFPTSYIKNEGTSGGVTRSADVASIPVADFGYNQSAGTVVVTSSIISPQTSQYNAFVQLVEDTNNRIDLGVLVNDGWQSIRTGGVDTAKYYTDGHNANIFDAGEVAITALAFSPTSTNSSANGSLGTEDTSSALPTAIQTLKIGVDHTSRYANGHIKSIKYYPRRLTNAQLQDLTS